MTRRRRPTRAIAAVLAVLAVLVTAGCVSIPTSGKVEQVEQVRGLPDNRSEIVPKPPVQDAPPRLIVEGFLLAMTRYEPNYDVARQFLTSASRQSWRPGDKVTIFDDRQLATTDDSAVLSATRTGVLGADGAYQPSSGELVQNFGMVKENGQWRIGNPPDGLLISQTSFASAFTPFDLYFYDPSFTALVPDPIYLPSEGRIEASLIQALLNGPSAWLSPAVTTAFPAKTTLNTNSVPVVDGLAQVSLSGQVAGLTDDQRSNLVAQITWTLRQQTGIRGVQLTVNNEPLTVRDQVTQGNETFIPIDAGAQKGPISPQASTTLVGASGSNGNTVVTVDETGESPVLRPVPGPFGKAAYAIDSLAASTSGSTLAAVTDGRTTLRRGAVAAVDPVVVLDKARALLRPQFTRYDELWTIGQDATGTPTIWVARGSSTVEVRPDWLGDLDVTAFRISPDGSRLAVVGEQNGSDVLALATIVRGDHLTIGPLREIQVAPSGSALRRLDDVGWITPTELIVLGSPGPSASVEPYGVEQDGSKTERLGSSDDWRATSIATAIDPSSLFRAVIAGQGDETWVYRSSDYWPPFSSKLRVPAYPG